MEPRLKRNKIVLACISFYEVKLKSGASDGLLKQLI